MSDPDVPPSSDPPPRIDPLVSQGAYSTGVIVMHTRDEFMLDFISGLESPARLIGRVLTTPPHAKRLLRALLENFGRYEEKYGAVSQQIEGSRAKPGQVKEIYGQLQISDEVLSGIFSNGTVIKHTQDLFIMDFTVNLPPAPKINARILMSPLHLRRIISVLGDNLSQYEDRFGKIADGGPASEQPMGFSLN